MIVKILHTSDWHLGQYFMQREQMRKKEHERFLDWLVEYLEQNHVDVLIIAGDIFDTRMPPNYALRMYFHFLHRVSQTSCGMTVVVGGNHDSVSTLHAPRELLQGHRVHVIGGATENIEDEVLVVKDAEENPIGIVCAVPFLADRDVRKFVPGESYEAKSKALLEGVKKHYRDVVDTAIAMREKVGNESLPIIASGHLYAAGGQASDGVRDLYVGSLGQIGAASFPEELSYVALGHLHVPQRVGGSEHIRYSGSPIALSFSETGKNETKKQLLLVELEQSTDSPQVTSVPIPEFQKLRSLKGTLEELGQDLKTLDDPGEAESIWVEIQVDTDVFKVGTKEHIQLMAQDHPLEILAIKPLRRPDFTHMAQESEETLEQLEVLDVFKKRLQAEANTENKGDDSTMGYTEDEENELLQAFNEVVNRVHDTSENL